MRFVKAVSGSCALMAFLAASSPATAEWRTEKLRGDFAIIGDNVCVNSLATSTQPPAGFTNLAPNTGTPISVSSNSFNGVITFNGDGTAAFAGRFVTLGHPGAAGAVDATAPSTYSVAADRTLTFVNGPSVSTSVAGPASGQVTSVSDVPPLIGRVSSDGDSITLGSFNPGVETLTQLVPNPGLVTSVRICHRAYSGIRIGKKPRSFGKDDD